MPGEHIPFEIVAGLGNPGERYAETRHNAGFWFVDKLARQYGVALKADKRLQAEIGSFLLDQRKVYLIKPCNFMNNSGQGLTALARFYKIAPEHVLVAHDELDLEPGMVRLKQGGGPGGHNGLRDIVNRLGSREFRRLRIGIGHPGDSRQVSDYVLKRASAEHQRLIDDAIDVALGQAAEMLTGDINVATKVINSHRSTTV